MISDHPPVAVRPAVVGDDLADLRRPAVTGEQPIERGRIGVEFDREPALRPVPHAPLARLEGEIAISTLLRRLPDLNLAVAPERLRWRCGLLLRGLEALPVKFGRHSLSLTGQGRCGSE